MATTSVPGIQCVILCGGKGERLRPLTEDIPKPLIGINGIPILGHILAHLHKFSFSEFMICTGYKSERIEEFFAGRFEAANVRIINSGDVDIIERLKGLKEYINGKFVLLYGDTISDVNLSELITFHEGHGRPATVTLWPLRSPFGVMEIDDGDAVTGYQEKPVLDKWINIGYFCFEPELLEIAQRYSTFQDLLSHLVENDLLCGFRHDGLHITINTVSELEDAKVELGGLKE